MTLRRHMAAPHFAASLMLAPERGKTRQEQTRTQGESLMRLARNLLLAAIAAVAALAFMATGASAQVEAELENGTHCGAIVEEADHNISGGCEVTAASTTNAITWQHTGASEAVTSSCENEFTANINEDGIGFIDVAETSVHTNPVAGCVIVACEESMTDHDELEWPISGLAEIGSERVAMLVTFCVVPFNAEEGTRNACTVVVHATQNHTTHVLTFSADEEPCHENHAAELSGAWSTAGSPRQIELHHDHYPGVN